MKIPDGYYEITDPEDLTQPRDIHINYRNVWVPSRCFGMKIGTWTTYARPIENKKVRLAARIKPIAARLRE